MNVRAVLDKRLSLRLPTRSSKRVSFDDIWIVFYVSVIIVATQVTLAYRPVAGVYVDAAAIAMLIFMALSREKARLLAISLTILPVANLLLLSLPQLSTFVQAVIFYDTLLLLALIYRYWFALDQPLTGSNLSLKYYAVFLPLMIIVGQVVGLIGYAFLRHHFIYEHQASWLLICLGAIVFAFAEEMLFRGLIQAEAMKVMSKTLAALLSAGLYAVMFIDHATLSPFIFAIIAGVALSATYYVKQNLLLTTTINATSKLVYIGLFAAFTLH